MSNCYFIESQLLLKTGKLEDAKIMMLKAFEIFDIDKEFDKTKDEMLLIKVRYLCSLANILYIKGEFVTA